MKVLVKRMMISELRYVTDPFSRGFQSLPARPSDSSLIICVLRYFTITANLLS